MADANGPDSDRRLDDPTVRQRLTRLDDLLDRIEQVPGPTADAAMEAIQTLTEVYGEALARVMGHADEELLAHLHDDELICHLLVLHDLDPDPVQRRVERAVAMLRAEVETRGGHVELVGVDDGVARIRLSGGGCKSCSSSASDLEVAVRESILALAPELRDVQSVEGGDGKAAPAMIPVEALLHRPANVGGTT